MEEQKTEDYKERLQKVRQRRNGKDPMHWFMIGGCAWKVERVSVGAPMATGGSVPPAAPSAMPEFTPGDAKDDLPF